MASAKKSGRGSAKDEFFDGDDDKVWVLDSKDGKLSHEKMLYDVKKANIMKKVKEGRKVVYKNHNLCWNSTFGCFPICCFGVKSEKSTFDAEVGPGVVIFYKTILNFIILFTCMTLFSIPAYITYFAAGDEAAKEL